MFHRIADRYRGSTAVVIGAGGIGAEHAGSVPLGVEGTFGRRGVVLRRELVGMNGGRHFEDKVSHHNRLRATAGMKSAIVATSVARG